MLAIEKIKKVTKENLPPITLLTGDDQGQYALLKEAFLKQIAFDSADLTYSYFDMSEADYDQAEMDLLSLPFFADEKVVIFDHFSDLTTDKKSYLEEAALKRFEAYLENPLSSTKLVLCAAGKLDGKRRLVKRLKRDAQVFDAQVLKEGELTTYFQKSAHDLGLIFDQGAFEHLLAKSNLDFAALAKNLTFLANYKQSGNISVADIEEAVPKSLQDNIFDLTQFVLTGRIDQANDLVRDLRLQGQDEIKLIAVMVGQFRIFTQVKILLGQNKSESQVVSSLSDYLGRKVNPYQVKFAIRDSRPLSLTFLKHCLACLIETDYQIKTGFYDKNYLFDLALLKIATGKK